MQPSGRRDRTSGQWRLPALPALASLLAIAVLAIVMSEGPAGAVTRIASAGLLELTLAAGAAFTGTMFAVTAIVTSQRRARRAEREAAALRGSLASMESTLKAEPQVLVLWSQDEKLKIVTHSLRTVAGLPSEEGELLKFGSWLDTRSTNELKASLDLLFDSGRPFTLLLRTVAGAHLEADGRTAGARAVLRLRDVAGYKSDLARIIDQHRRLATDINACRLLLDALPMPVWFRDTRKRLEWVNQAYVRAVEARGASEVYARQIELLESRQRTAVDRQLAAGRPFAGRADLIMAGERKPHEVFALATAEASAAVAIDVAALETVQAKLQQNAQTFDRTLNRVATAVAVFGADRSLTFFNDAYVRLWQLDREWLATSPSDGQILDRLRQDGLLPAIGDYKAWKEKILSGYRKGTEIEDRWHLPDGRAVHVLTALRPDGGMTYLYDDETERYALESRYNALIHVQRETLDSLKEGVAVFATDGKLKLFNTAFLAIWKLARQQLEAEPHIDQIIAQTRLFYDDRETWARISRAVTSITDEREQIDGQMVRPDQSVIDYAATPLPDGAALLIFADITDNKRYERALIERNEALVASDRLKSHFLGHVSYELRTPLTSIIGFTELLSSPHAGALNPKQREYLDDITVSSKKLLSIIDDILDQASIDAGALELKLAPVKVRALIEAAILGVRDRATRGRITIDVAVAKDVHELIADESRVRQILYNLLSNAIGFSRPGDTIRISCWSEGPMMAFSIEDQGVGIPVEQQRRVFERFESRSQGSRHRGAGLGLSIVKSLVELHGGDLSLVSEPSRGTCVTVRLPESGIRPLEAETQRGDVEQAVART